MHPRFPVFSSVCMAAVLACPHARALDLSKATAVPAPVTDNVLQIGERRLRLPPGDWVLTGQRLDETVGRQGTHERTGTGVAAWATLVEHGEIRAMAWVAMPVEEFPLVHRPSHNQCGEDDQIARLDLSRSVTLPECLAVYGHRDLASVLVRAPRTLAWLREHHVADPGPVVRFVYKIRTTATYGDVMMVFPTAPFATDAEATRWANGLREATRPLLEGRATEGALPPLPPAQAAATPPKE